tara:strand:- start:4901 stop:5032 length:132 start_codon:yes stop_codon:yes gene_type:complete
LYLHVNIDVLINNLGKQMSIFIGGKDQQKPPPAAPMMPKKRKK